MARPSARRSVQFSTREVRLEQILLSMAPGVRVTWDGWVFEVAAGVDRNLRWSAHALDPNAMLTPCGPTKRAMRLAHTVCRLAPSAFADPAAANVEAGVSS